jgi:hypothetical protein
LRGSATGSGCHRFGRRPEGTDAGLRPWPARQPNYRPSPTPTATGPHTTGGFRPAATSPARVRHALTFTVKPAARRPSRRSPTTLPTRPPAARFPQHDRRLIAYTTSRDTTSLAEPVQKPATLPPLLRGVVERPTRPQFRIHAAARHHARILSNCCRLTPPARFPHARHSWPSRPPQPCCTRSRAAGCRANDQAISY